MNSLKKYFANNRYYTQKYPDKDENEIVAMYRQQMIDDILNDNRLKGRVFVHQ